MREKMLWSLMLAAWNLLQGAWGLKLAAWSLRLCRACCLRLYAWCLMLRPEARVHAGSFGILRTVANDLLGPILHTQFFSLILMKFWRSEYMCHLVFTIWYIFNFFIPTISAILALVVLLSARTRGAAGNYSRGVVPAATCRLVDHWHAKSYN